MVKLTFEFNEELIKKNNITKDELLKEMREYARANDIVESSYGVFKKDGEDALCLLSMIAVKIAEKCVQDTNYLNMLELDVDGEKEDCIRETKEWLQEERIIFHYDGTPGIYATHKIEDKSEEIHVNSKAR